jgi:hypothetical protein
VCNQPPTLRNGMPKSISDWLFEVQAVDSPRIILFPFKQAYLQSTLHFGLYSRVLAQSMRLPETETDILRSHHAHRNAKAIRCHAGRRPKGLIRVSRHQL